MNWGWAAGWWPEPVASMPVQIVMRCYPGRLPSEKRKGKIGQNRRVGMGRLLGSMGSSRSPLTMYLPSPRHASFLAYCRRRCGMCDALMPRLVLMIACHSGCSRQDKMGWPNHCDPQPAPYSSSPSTSFTSNGCQPNMLPSARSSWAYAGTPHCAERHLAPSSMHACACMLCRLWNGGLAACVRLHNMHGTHCG
jgi:hypothetical protein